MNQKIGVTAIGPNILRMIEPLRQVVLLELTAHWEDRMSVVFEMKREAYIPPMRSGGKGLPDSHSTGLSSYWGSGYCKARSPSGTSLTQLKRDQDCCGP